MSGGQIFGFVSTHSRLKAAGEKSRLGGKCYTFQHTAA